MSRRINLELTSTQLSNGLTVLVQPDHRTPVFSFQTWVRAGSASDPSHRTGMAHLFEHLMFKGTRTVPEGEFDRLVEEMGGRTNAATWLDWTQFYVDAPTASFQDVVDLEFDRITNLAIDVDSLETEREVILNERGERVDDDPDGMMSERLWHMVFDDEPYGQPTIGWEKHIRVIDVADCERFYSRWYTPEHILIVVAGDIDPQNAIETIRRSYGTLERAPQIPAPVRETVFAPLEARTEHVEIATGGERLLIGYRAPAGTLQDSAALEMLNEILFVGDSSRGERTLVTESEVAAGVYGFVATLRQIGLYEIGVDCRPGRTAVDALHLIDQLFNQVRQEGIAQSELLKARNRIEMRLYKELQTAQSRAQALGYWGVVANDPEHLFERAERLSEVELADLMRVVNTWLKPNERMIVHGHPIEEEAV